MARGAAHKNGATGGAQPASSNDGIAAAPDNSAIKVAQVKAQTEGAENVTAEVAASTPASKPATSNINLFVPIDFGPNSFENWAETRANQAIANIFTQSKQEFGYGASTFELLGAFGGGVWDGFTGQLDSKGRYVGIQIHKGVEDGFYATDAGLWANRKGRGYGDELYHFTLGDYKDSSTFAFYSDMQALGRDMGGFGHYLYKNMSVESALNNIQYSVGVVADFASGIWSDVKGFFAETSSVELARRAGLTVGEVGGDFAVDFALGGAYWKGAQLAGKMDGVFGDGLVKVWNKLEATFPYQPGTFGSLGGNLFTDKFLPIRLTDNFGKPIPYGFNSVEDFDQFVTVLADGLPEGTHIVFKGSSVTGKSFKTGEVFDVGRVSDFDIALVNDDLFIESLELGRDFGFKMKTDPNRIGPFLPEQSAELGLRPLQLKLSEMAGRDVNFMLYETLNSALMKNGIFVK